MRQSTYRSPRHLPTNRIVTHSSELGLSVIDLRAQMALLEQQIQALQPAFFAACVALNTDKIALERAVISRRLTPGQWAYSPDIVEQSELLKLLKRQFQQSHEPIAGREVTWAIKLLITSATAPSAVSSSVGS